MGSCAHPLLDCGCQAGGRETTPLRDRPPLSMRAHLFPQSISADRAELPSLIQSPRSCARGHPAGRKVHPEPRGCQDGQLSPGTSSRGALLPLDIYDAVQSSKHSYGAGIIVIIVLFYSYFRDEDTQSS